MIFKQQKPSSSLFHQFTNKFKFLEDSLHFLFETFTLSHQRDTKKHMKN
jgi:hypothetical protein